MPIEEGQNPPQNGPKDLTFYYLDGAFDAVDQNGYHYAMAVTDISKGGPVEIVDDPGDPPKPSDGEGNQGGLTTDVEQPPK